MDRLARLFEPPFEIMCNNGFEEVSGLYIEAFMRTPGMSNDPFSVGARDCTRRKKMDYREPPRSYRLFLSSSEPRRLERKDLAGVHQGVAHFPSGWFIGPWFVESMV
jgi:hypothetical protein